MHMQIYDLYRTRQDEQFRIELSFLSYAINDITAHHTTPCNILIKYYTIVLLYDYFTMVALYYTTILYYIIVPLYYYRQHTIAHHSPSHHTAS